MTETASQNILTFMGAPGSPYTRKMRAVLRYRHIPSRMILQMSAEHQSRPQPRVPLLPTFYLPDAEGTEVAVTDFTPRSAGSSKSIQAAASSRTTRYSPCSTICSRILATNG